MSLLRHILLAFFPVSSLVSHVVQAEQMQRFGNVTRPPMPCFFEHESPWIKLKLLDPNDGLPFINDKGVLKKTAHIPESMPEYELKRVNNSSPEIYDLKLGEEYLALFDDGTLGFTNASSNGTKQISLGKKNYMTTIFTISCEGLLSISLPESVNFGFARHESSKDVYAHSATIIKHAREKRSLELPFLERSVAATKSKAPELRTFTFLAGPVMISDYYQKGYSPRCSAQVPYGLQAMLKPGARAAYYNGCGPENGFGLKLPDLRFEDCCNDHDLCYDDCAVTWEDCNDNFRKCNIQACNTSYPYLANESWYQVDPIRWGCWQLADTYADAVGTRIGAWAFNASNIDRCECNCPAGSFDCGQYCMTECEEINENAVVNVRKGEPDDYLIPLNELPGI